jgi:hypothetical protein
MSETKTRKNISPVKSILRTLILNNILGKPSNIEENTCLDLQDSNENFNAYERIAREKAQLDAEYTKAEAMINLQRQKFI